MNSACLHASELWTLLPRLPLYTILWHASPPSCTDPHPGSIPVPREVVVYRLRHPYMIVNAWEPSLRGRSRGGEGGPEKRGDGRTTLE